MRIVEVINKVTEDSGAKEQQDALLTILVNELSSAESSTNPNDAVLPFSVLSAEVYNVTGIPMDYEAFLQLKDMDPGAFENLIRDHNDQEIVLNTDSGEEISFSDPENIDEPSQNTVDDMAKRAMKKRI